MNIGSESFEGKLAHVYQLSWEEAEEIGLINHIGNSIVSQGFQEKIKVTNIALPIPTS